MTKIQITSTELRAIGQLLETLNAFPHSDSGDVHKVTIDIPKFKTEVLDAMGNVLGKLVYRYGSAEFYAKRF